MITTSNDFSMLRFFRVDGVHCLFALHKTDGIGVSAEDADFHAHYSEELVKAIPDVEEHLRAGTLETLNKITWLDKTGPALVSLHTLSGSMNEAVDPQWLTVVENEQVAILLQEKIKWGFPDIDGGKLRVNITVLPTTYASFDDAFSDFSKAYKEQYDYE